MGNLDFGDEELENDDFDEEDFDDELSENNLSDKALKADVQNGIVTFIVLLILSMAAFVGMIVFIVKALEVSKALNSLSCPAFPKDGWFECTSETNKYDFAKSGYIAGFIFLAILGAMLLFVAIAVKKSFSKEKLAKVFNDERTKIATKNNQTSRSKITTCPYCGTKNSKTAHHCKSCGASL